MIIYFHFDFISFHMENLIVMVCIDVLFGVVFNGVVDVNTV